MYIFLEFHNEILKNEKSIKFSSEEKILNFIVLFYRFIRNTILLSVQTTDELKLRSIIL
jgi:hypothetical protein